jgi:hypothetical protein
VRDRIFIAGLLSAALFVSCTERRGPPIDFIIPPSVHGLIVIIEDKQNGEDVDADAPVFFVPTNAVLRLKTLAPFRRWHTVNARYMPGPDIPSGYYNTSPDDDVVRLFGLSSSSAGKDFYYLGTHRQARETYGRLHELSREIR